MKSGSLNFLQPSGPVQACSGTDLPFTISNVKKRFARIREAGEVQVPVPLDIPKIDMW